MAWMLPCWTLIGDQDVCREETEWWLAHFYSLITFTGPQSHLCIHGDADKVTHDYSSMVLPDWTAPESPCKTYSSALEPVSLLYLSTPSRMRRLNFCCSHFVFNSHLKSFPHPEPHLSSPLTCTPLMSSPFMTTSPFTVPLFLLTCSLFND